MAGVDTDFGGGGGVLVGLWVRMDWEKGNGKRDDLLGWRILG